MMAALYLWGLLHLCRAHQQRHLATVVASSDVRVHHILPLLRLCQAALVAQHILAVLL